VWVGVIGVVVAGNGLLFRGGLRAGLVVLGGLALMGAVAMVVRAKR
jgi:hypothetical protein